MSSETTHTTTARAREPRTRLVVVVGLAVIAGLVAWLVLRDDGTSSSSQPQTATARAASAAEIKALAASVQHPVFWLGPKSGFTYELTETPSGKIYIRYLPGGVDVGAGEPYLTVVTYPFPGAYPAVQQEAAKKGAVAVDVARGGLAVLDGRYPESVHLAYPNVNYQVEVYDPKPARAMQLVSAGELAVVGQLDQTPPATSSTGAATGTPAAASETDLQALAASIGHAIYWAGPSDGFTYELTQTSTGRVFVRYLPAGVAVGSPDADYLTVATYPFPDALAAVQEAAKAEGAESIELAGGGLAVIDPTYPKSIHIAYPGSDYQIEVFDPSPDRVREIVSSGRITAIG